MEEDSRQTEFEYDRQGNMVSERSGSGTTTYSYDAFNRTAKVEKPDGSPIRHLYDPEGLRSGLRENGITSRFVYDGWNMVNELDGDHNIKASYVRGHEWLAQVDGRGDSYYYLNNQHGDVAHITNRLGGIVNSYEYDAFGRTLSATEGIPNRFRYAGEQFDHTTEQYYLRARFYNPVIARFTQEDEYRGDGLNLYAYVGNNPINYVDPSGYSSQSVGCGGGGKKEGPFEETGNGSWKPGMEVTEGHIREAMKNAPLQTNRELYLCPLLIDIPNVYLMVRFHHQLKLIMGLLWMGIIVISLVELPESIYQ
ncbi:RHS repeat-associated core domain-containing protein [Paenibacillus apiarius]|uniref:RHS repeat domain-containing protein n=1 Tax=Paenibacillus apiarius TaxID=46240 RepID=UPI00197FBB45|nr:RHS repeat-associated core domain-containing protein [Paenibacillus apiarius]